MTSGLPRRPRARARRVFNPGSRYRNICFTINNPTDAEIEWLEDNSDPDTLEDRKIRYIVWQTEMEGTRHIQGYLELTDRKTGRVIKRELGNRAHLEPRFGTAEQAAAYCKKEQTRVEGSSGEYGTRSQQGRRKDCLAEVCTELNKKEMTLEEIEDQFPVQYLKYKNKIVETFIEKQGSRHLTPGRDNVHIYVGPSGAGKTTTAWFLYPKAYKGIWPQGGRWWWPNYKGQEVIIFDEFRENISYQQMLALMDIHPMGIEYKGGNSENISKQIIITTIRDPKTWYKKVEDKSELLRRIRENSTIFDFSRPAPARMTDEEEEEGEFDITAINREARNMEDFQFDAPVTDDFRSYGSTN